MFAKALAKRQKDGGFTLIELLVVIIIIGILAAVAIPVFLNQKNKAADSAVKSDLRNAAIVMEDYFVDNNTYTLTGTLADAGFRPSESINAAITVTEDTDELFCLDLVSNSGEAFSYHSAEGGLAQDTCANR